MLAGARRMVRTSTSSMCLFKPCLLHVASDILHLKVFGTSLVILNSYKSAKDILEKRSANSR